MIDPPLKIYDNRYYTTLSLYQSVLGKIHQNTKRLRERSGLVVECLTRDRDRRFEPHWSHCFVVLEQDTSRWEDPSLFN